MIGSGFSWDEVDILITFLREFGVSYLWGNGSAKAQVSRGIKHAELIRRLATCGYPLVENASISLFILHPEFATDILDVLEQNDHDIAERVTVLTLATLYMQYWWWFRLTIALGRIPDFPEEPFVVLWEERHLPAPSEGYGLKGLLALQEYQQQKYNVPLNFIHDWQNQIDHLLQQEEANERKLHPSIIEKLRQHSLQE